MTTVGRWSPNKVRKRLLEDTWVFPNSGMILMRPTSIVVAGVGATASIGVNGSVTFTSATSLSLNGVFTSAYDNYMISIRFTNATGTTTLQYRLRASGTDNSTTNSYVTQELTADSTSVLGGRYTANLAYFGTAYATQRSGLNMNVYGPFLTQPTASRSVTVGDYLSAYSYDAAHTHNQSTSYDGLTVLLSAGSITGLVSVYGLGG